MRPGQVVVGNKSGFWHGKIRDERRHRQQKNNEKKKGTITRGGRTRNWNYLRGTMVNRTYGIHKKLYISNIFTRNIWSYLPWSPAIEQEEEEEHWQKKTHTLHAHGGIIFRRRLLERCQASKNASRRGMGAARRTCHASLIAGYFFCSEYAQKKLPGTITFLGYCMVQRLAFGSKHMNWS